MSRVVVGAVLALAALALLDTLDAERSSRTDGTQSKPSVAGAEPRRATPQRVDDFQPTGSYLRTRVLRNGRPYLEAAAIDAAFPSPEEGPLDISSLAVASDGTLALAVYRFPATEPMQGAVELWRDGRPEEAFTVPDGTLGGGISFSADGGLILLASADGRRHMAFSRSGYRVADSASERPGRRLVTSLPSP